MAHILFVTSGIASILHANFGLIKQLTAAGHQVTYASPDDARERVETQGIKYIQLKPRTRVLHLLGNEDNSGSQWLKNFFNRQPRLDKIIDEIRDTEYEALIQKMQPDLIIIDMEYHRYIMSSVGLGFPVALTTVIFSHWKRANIPPIHFDIVPKVGWRGSKLGMEYAWYKYWFFKWRRLVRQWLRHAGLNDVSVFRELAKVVGFPFKEEALLFGWHIPMTYKTLPVLNTNSPHFDLPHEPYPSSIYTGAVVVSERKTKQTEAIKQANEQLNHMLHSRHDSTRPLIYCAFGAQYKGNDTVFWQRMLAAMSQLPEYDFILGLGRRIQLDDFGDRPSHIHAFEWVPQLDVLAHADAAVVHGGIGTINECIYYAVPMLSYPFSVMDQKGCSARIAYHGLGIFGDREHDDVATIVRYIRQIVTQANFKKNVENMSAKFHEELKTISVADIVEDIMSKSQL